VISKRGCTVTKSFKMSIGDIELHTTFLSYYSYLNSNVQGPSEERVPEFM